MKLKAEDITPQSLESNDGRFLVEVCDEGFLKIVMTDLTNADHNYYHDEKDFVQELIIDFTDLDRLIKILEIARQINPYKLDGG